MADIVIALVLSSQVAHNYIEFFNESNPVFVGITVRCLVVASFEHCDTGLASRVLPRTGGAHSIAVRLGALVDSSSHVPTGPIL